MSSTGENNVSMRIGIDARIAYYTRAGIGQYTWRLIQALAALDRADQFHIFRHRRDQAQFTRQGNFQHHALWTPSHNRLEIYLLGLELLWSGLELDILHSTDFIPPQWHPRGCKSVITIHDLAFMHYPHFLTKASARYYGQIEDAVKRADLIIAVSNSTRRDIVNLLGVDEQKITVIYEAPNPIYRPMDRSHARAQVQARYPVPDDFILFVSTIEPRKNVQGLLKAFRRLLDDYKLDVTLVLAGAKGWLSQEAYDLVHELKLDKQCLFLGAVNDEDLVFLFNAARCLAYPSFYEGFGLPPLEAMTCGTPTVVANVSSLPEVVGDAALLVSPNSTEELTVALWRLLTDDQLWLELQQKGFKRAERFSWARTGREPLDVYRRVSAHSAAAPPPNQPEP